MANGLALLYNFILLFVVFYACVPENMQREVERHFWILIPYAIIIFLSYFTIFIRLIMRLLGLVPGCFLFFTLFMILYLEIYDTLKYEYIPAKNCSFKPLEQVPLPDRKKYLFINLIFTSYLNITIIIIIIIIIIFIINRYV